MLLLIYNILHAQPSLLFCRQLG